MEKITNDDIVLLWPSSNDKRKIEIFFGLTNAVSFTSFLYIYRFKKALIPTSLISLKSKRRADFSHFFSKITQISLSLSLSLTLSLSLSLFSHLAAPGQVGQDEVGRAGGQLEGEPVARGVLVGAAHVEAAGDVLKVPLPGVKQLQLDEAGHVQTGGQGLAGQ